MNPNIPPEFLSTGVWLWENYGKEFISKTVLKLKGQAQKQWQNVEWALESKKYRERMYELYSSMRMLGIPNPVPVEGIYTDVYILDSPTAFQRHDIQQLKANYSDYGYITEIHKRQKAIDLLNKEDRLFILGKPGAGKTTLLKYITILAAKGDIDKVPIFISLNDWVQSNKSIMNRHDLITYIVNQFEICSFPEAQVFIEEILLKKGRAILLFDGLDEVNEENQLRNQAIRIIKDFTNQYPKNKYLITCRVAATDYAFEQFPYVEISDFSEEQISIFASKWFNTQPEKYNRFIVDLNKFENRGLLELARTPILLNLLCLNFDETLEFPLKKSEIYQEAIDVLLKRWDSSRNIKRDEIYRGLSIIRKRQLLSQIAAEYFQNNEIFFSGESAAMRIRSFLETLPDINNANIDGEATLKAIEGQHGILIERAREIHSFSHLSIQEYFTSRYILENISNEVIVKLFKYLFETRWREIFIMVAGSLPNADNFFNIFKKEINSHIKEHTKLREFKKYLKYLYNLAPDSAANRLAMLNFGAIFNSNFINQTIELYEASLELQKVIDNGNPSKIHLKCNKLLEKLNQLDSKGRIYFRDGGVLRSFRSNVLLSLDDDAQQLFKDIELGDIDGFYTQLNEVFHSTKKILSVKINDKSLIRLKSDLDYIRKLSLDITDALHTALQIELKLKSRLGIKDIEFEWFNKYNFLKIKEFVEQKEFKEYFYVQKLAIDCLQIAAVSNRRSIINSIFIV